MPQLAGWRQYAAVRCSKQYASVQFQRLCWCHSCHVTFQTTLWVAHLLLCATHMLLGPQVTSPQPHCCPGTGRACSRLTLHSKGQVSAAQCLACVCPSCPSCDEVHPGTAWVPPLVSARQPSPQPPCPTSALNSHHQQPVQLQMGCSCAKYQKACFLCSSGRPTAMLPGTTTGVQGTSTGLSAPPLCVAQHSCCAMPSATMSPRRSYPAADRCRPSSSSRRRSPSDML